MSSALQTDREEDELDEQERYERLAESPPSVKLVYYVLSRNEGAIQPELAEETLLPDRTIRYALKRLEEHDIVRSEVDLSDPRRRRYTLKPVDDSR